MVGREFNQAVIALETALATTLRAITETGTPEQIESFTKLLIQKEVVLASLLEKVRKIEEGVKDSHSNT